MTVCEMCKEPIIGGRTDTRRKYCAACAIIRNVERNRERRHKLAKPKEPKLCEMCKTEFVPYFKYETLCKQCKPKKRNEYNKEFKRKIKAKKVKNTEPKVEKQSGIDPKFLVRGNITYSGGISSIQGGGM